MNQSLEQHEILWILSFLKIGIRMVGMPIKWIQKNSRIWNVRITESGVARITEDGKIRVV